ncbi:MAG TPA: hypothetical protein PLX89_22070 [Verrucomicrobiota bacterium]|nr:hypothetical protein [Verrucomicrobiales bacterium]HRI15693.1 hypothetical protein [Verrucomicrobiota bacterium]
MPTLAKILDLRQLLAERLPQVRSGFAPAASLATLPTGVPVLDTQLGGGIPVGETTELVGAGLGSGTAQVVHRLLRQTALNGQFLALVDGVDSFDADAAEPSSLARLLWVRCQKASEAIQATDLLLRDRNFPLVVLDLKLNPATQLQRISGSVWHRFNRLLEQHRTTLLVVTDRPLVGGTGVRVQVSAQLDVEALAHPPVELLGRLQFTVLRALATGGEAQGILTG